MKKFDIKDVFSWSNAEDAKQYIDKYCYFSSRLDTLKKAVNEDTKYILQKVCTQEDAFVNGVFRDVDDDCWGLCLPAEKVIEVGEPKKWRAFKSIDEFKKETGLDLLHIVHYRLSPSRSITSKGSGVITEFNTSGSDKTDYITIGDTAFNLNELFNYEYFDKLGKWHPFGVEE